MPLFDATPIDVGLVRALVKEHWELELGECLKASQNHTFVAQAISGSPPAKFIVRVTPDASGARAASIELELILLRYLHEHGLEVCPPVAPPHTGEPAAPRRWHVRAAAAGLSLCVFPFAAGQPVVLTDWASWLCNAQQAAALGRWLGRLHTLTRQFAVEHPELAARARLWSDLHDGVLRDARIAAEDQQSADSPAAFGLLHGDVNISNFHWDAEHETVIVFDWDQVQRGWFLYDVAQPIWTVVTIAGAGSPIDRSPVPEANVARYAQWLLQGYEAVVGHAVDRAALERMLLLRRELYWQFCRRAVHELAPDSFMGQFCAYMVQWLERGGGLPPYLDSSQLLSEKAGL